MLRIKCPYCGERDHSEFSYEGDATVPWPPLGSDDADAWHRAVFLRDNPAGRHTEYWHHVHGCRAWLIVERDTTTHEIFAVRAAHPGVAAVLGAGKP